MSQREVVGREPEGTWVLRWADKDKFESGLLGSEKTTGLGVRTPAGLSHEALQLLAAAKKVSTLKSVGADLTALVGRARQASGWVSPVQGPVPRALFVLGLRPRAGSHQPCRALWQPPADFSRLPAGLRRVSVGSRDSPSLAGRQRLPLQPTLPRKQAKSIPDPWRGREQAACHQGAGNASGFRHQVGEHSLSCAGHRAGWRSAAKKRVQPLEQTTRGDRLPTWGASGAHRALGTRWTSPCSSSS